MSNNNGPVRLSKGERRYKLELAVNHIYKVRNNTTDPEDFELLNRIAEKIEELKEQIRWRSE